MRIGFDVDGVLADFNYSFINYVVDLLGKDLFPTRPFAIPTWDYPQHYGYTPEEVNRVWNQIIKMSTFWLTLGPYPEAMAVLERLRILTTDHDVYFVTSRPGVRSKSQTETWLATHSGDFMWGPTVLISSDKGAVAKALKLDVYIDDRWENAVDVATATRPYQNEPLGLLNQPQTRTYLLDRPWNQSSPELDAAFHLNRVKSATAMLDDLNLFVDRVAA